MSELSKELNIIQLVKEVIKSDVENFELEYKDLKIKVQARQAAVVDTKPMLPSANEEQIEEMKLQESKTIAERIKERDETLLHDLDYLAPELAGDLRRDNIIKEGANGAYEFVEGETLDG